MTAGEALKRENIAGYNCSYVAVNRVHAFDEILYVLMNGTGVGFSVERQHVGQLPIIADEFSSYRNYYHGCRFQVRMGKRIKGTYRYVVYWPNSTMGFV